MELQELIKAVYGTVLSKRASIYCSVPITSGRRYYDWLAKVDTNLDNTDSYNEEVYIPNIEYANKLVENIRTKVSYVVINPAAMPKISGWGQNKWLNLWEDVIIAHAHTVVFANGWQYSNGCVYEFFVAQSRYINCCDETFEHFGINHGIDLIKKAIATIKEKTFLFEARQLEIVLSELKSLRVPDYYSELY